MFDETIRCCVTSIWLGTVIFYLAIIGIADGSFDYGTVTYLKNMFL